MTMHVDVSRRIPLALVGAVVMQAAAMLWWVAGKNSELHYQNERLTTLEHASDRTTTSLDSIAERLARIEERQAATLQLLTRLEREGRR